MIRPSGNANFHAKSDGHLATVASAASRPYGRGHSMNPVA